MPRTHQSHISALSESSASTKRSVGQGQKKRRRKNECAARVHYTEVAPRVFTCNLCAARTRGREVTVEQNKYSCSMVLWRHLQNVHCKEYNALKAHEGSSSNQPSMANIFDRQSTGKLYFTRRTTETTKEELVRFICQAAAPWNIVCKKYFVRLLRYIAQEKISIPLTRAVKVRAFKLYTELKSGIRVRLEGVEKVAITLDCWTSANRISFLGLTVHWVDAEWKMCDCVLAIRQLEGSHSGECLSEIVLEVLANFNLNAKVYVVTMDNASNNTTMMATLERELRSVNPHFTAKRHVLCITHVINLVMQAGLKALDVVGEGPEETFLDEVDLTDIVDVFDAEELAGQAISLGDIGRRLRKVVVAIRGSSKKETKYFSYCRQLNMTNTRRISLDCPTRWSSTFKMLRGCIEKKFIIDMLLSNVLRKRSLLDVEWDLIEKFVDLLKPLQQGTSVAIRSKAPASNEGIVIIKGLMRYLERIRVGVTESSMLLAGHAMPAR
ncbi:putative transcriptional regulator tpeD [Wolffia australiana]